MNRTELRLRLLELERRINHLHMMQSIQHNTIEAQDRTIGHMSRTIVDLKTKDNWVFVPDSKVVAGLKTS